MSKQVKRYITCTELPGHLPDVVVCATDYAALEAARDQYRDLSIKYGDKLSEVLKERDAALAELAALKGGQAKDETHAQPEVAQNTGSQAMANNQLQRQGRAAGHGVEAVAAVNEASEASDIFAWATFDGEGSYELRLYENNESYQDEWLARESAKYAGWVFPLYKTAQPAQASAWVPVSESLPADRRDVMLYCADTKEHFVGFSKGGGLFQFARDGNGISIVCRPSHWRYIEDSDAPTPGASDGKGGAN